MYRYNLGSIRIFNPSESNISFKVTLIQGIISFNYTTIYETIVKILSVEF